MLAKVVKTAFKGALGVVVVYYSWKACTFYVQYRRLSRFFKDFPSPKKNFIGNFRRLDFWDGLAKEYELEPYFVFWIFGRPKLVIHRPESMAALCTSTTANDKDYQAFIKWVGPGLICSSGAKWAQHRKLLSGAFRQDILVSYLPIFERHAESICSRIAQTKGETFDFYEIIQRSMLDVLLETVMGLDHRYTSQFSGQEITRFLDNVRNLFFLVVQHFIDESTTLRIIARYNSTGREFHRRLGEFRQFTQKVLALKVRSYHEKHDPLTGTSLIDLLLNIKIVQGQFTEQDVLDELYNFIFAGFDTTSTALAWMLHQLATHGDCQESAREELQHKLTADSRQLGMEQLARLEYLEMVMKECQRLSNSVNKIERLVTDATHLRLPKRHPNKHELMDVELPAGTQIMIFLRGLHLNRDVWGPDVNEFRPERFLPAEQERRNKFAFVPFSAGMRNCIGQRFAQLEMKITLVRLLKRFKFTTSQTFVECEPSAGGLFIPIKGIKLEATAI